MDHRAHDRGVRPAQRSRRSPARVRGRRNGRVTGGETDWQPPPSPAWPYVDEVSTEALDRVVTAVRARLRSVPVFDVTFHRPVVLGEAIALPPTPAQPVHDLRGAVRQGVADALGEDSVHTGPEQARGFRPHVSLAYINAAGHAAPYVSALGAVEPAPATVCVAEVALIVLDRLLEPDWLYRWTTRAVVPLRTP